MGDLVLFLCHIYLNLNIFLPNAVHDLGTLLQPLGPGVPGLSSAQPRLDRFVPRCCIMPLNPLRNGEVAPPHGGDGGVAALPGSRGLPDVV